MLAWVVPILPDQPLVWCAAFRSTGQGLPTDAVACYSALRCGVSQTLAAPTLRRGGATLRPASKQATCGWRGFQHLLACAVARDGASLKINPHPGCHI
jgi:hypothetical protein